MSASSAEHGFHELHSVPLVTSEEHSRKPIGRLAERLPTLDDGSITVFPDGRMRVVYTLRPGVTWHDGTPFTARDLVFTHQFMRNPDVPMGAKPVMALIQSAEATDASTLVLNYSATYYKPDMFGLNAFWPLPQHILEPAYERYLSTRNSEELINLPYWTSEYVHLGPFRLAAYDPADTIVLQAYDGYFLGKPKLDTVRVKIFTDSSTLFANLLAGTVDLFVENTVAPAQGFELMDRWGQSGEGTVHLMRGAYRFISPQLRPHIQVEPAALEPRVRAALYQAIDREELSEALQGGHRELAAYEIVAPGELLHPASKDSLRRYAYDPQRARAILAEAGWTPGPDGKLRHATDGRRFRAPISGTAGRDREQETAAIADYWRRIGLEPEEMVIPAAQVRSNEYRASFPGWEATSSSPRDDGAIVQLQGPAASAETRWTGNRRGYENPRADDLINRFQVTLPYEGRFQILKTLSDMVAEDLPFLMTFYTAYHVGASRRVKALDDYDGGGSVGTDYGTFVRNGHLWELR
jgi:peptide/nickel transport system substrate-binding protein